MVQGARGSCTGMTQRGGMGREVEGGFRMGNTCTLMADSNQCMAKPIQYCKVKLKKKQKFKKRKSIGPTSSSYRCDGLPTSMLGCLNAGFQSLIIVFLLILS